VAVYNLIATALRYYSLMYISVYSRFYVKLLLTKKTRAYIIQK